MNTTITLSDTDLLTLALAVSGSATSAYIDERLHVAADEHFLASRLWAYAGRYEASRKHHNLSHAIRHEIIELTDAN